MIEQKVIIFKMISKEENRGTFVMCDVSCNCFEINTVISKLLKITVQIYFGNVSDSI